MDRLEFKGIVTSITDDNFYTVYPCENSRVGNYYFLSNDRFSLKLFKRRDWGETVILGVANPHFLHVIGLLTGVTPFKRIIAVDSNTEQLVHFSRLCNTIIQSYNRIDYLQRLFKVRFNGKAIKLLQGLSPSNANQVRGGVEKDSLFTIEKELWSNLCFDKELFCNTYNLNVEIINGGLLIHADTVGDINTYVATFLCCSRSDYDFWPFSAAFGSGFLRNEETFRQMKEVLQVTPLYMLHADLAKIYSDLLASNRYHPMYVWCSNLLCDYFVNKNPAISQIANISKLLGVQVEPNFPEIDLVLLQDERTMVSLPELIDNTKTHHRQLSVHTLNFAKICRYMRGAKAIEIISECSWFDQDEGISKLPNTSYVMVDDFLSFDMDSTYDSIIIHILVGHGVEQKVYEMVLLKARTLTGNLIVLEHNRLSRDFSCVNIGITIDDVRDILGMESIVDYGPGVCCNNRNLILVYRK